MSSTPLLGTEAAELTSLLAQCAAEPIHALGSVQPFGALIAVDAAARIVAASANASEHYEGPLIGRSIHEVLDPGMVELLDGLLAAGAGSENAIQRALTRRGLVPTAIHRNADGLWIVELWDEPGEDRTGDALSILNEILSVTLGMPTEARTLIDFLPVAAEYVAEALGFDRVMVYRFAEDGSGEIVAEHRATGSESFLGLRFPASDIPSQARRLFQAHPLRFIRDVAYAPVPIHSSLPEPLDLSASVVRGVSPIHCRYLANMGVRSSLALSLVTDDRLWGLVACHGLRPHVVPLQLWPMLRLFARALSTRIQASELMERTAAQMKSASIAQLLIARLHATASVTAALLAGAPSLRDLIRCDGVTVSYQGQRFTVGTVPPNDVERLSELFARGPANLDEDGCLIRTAGLPGLEGQELPGVLAFAFGPTPSDFVAWYRRELVRTVQWAGDPTKPLGLDEVTGAAVLAPRSSFAAWTESVAGIAEPWSRSEVGAALALRDSLRDIALRVSGLYRQR